jgi:hypothetical protein
MAQGSTSMLASLSLEALLATLKKVFSSGLSLYCGVSWKESEQKWKLNISIRGKTKRLGCFLLEEDAARAYDIAARQKNGRKAPICFIM